MQYIAAFIMALMSLTAAMKEKNVYNPTTIFCGVWTLTTILSGLHLFDLTETSAYIYFYALLGVTAFFIGVTVRDRVKLRLDDVVGFGGGRYVRLNYKFLFLFYTPILLFTIKLAIGSIRQLMNGVSMETIRFNYSDETAGLVMTNNLEHIIENYFVQASVFASVALIPILVGYGKSMKKYILLLELLALHAAYIFASGARSFLIDIIFLFVVYVMMDKKISQSLKDFFVKLPKVVIVGIVLGSLFMVILVTILRKGEGSLPREIYRYFSICFPLFERHIDVKEASNIPYTYGWGLLHGIVKPEFVIVRKFFGLQFPSMLEQAATQIEWNNEFFAVGGGNANSFVTLFYYMYMDFGVPGIVFGCFFYGYLAQSVYKRVVMNPDSRMIAFYLLIAIGLFLSFARFHFTAHRYVYAFLILALSFRREPDAEIEPIGECA